jgi:hypothetical protein
MFRDNLLVPPSRVKLEDPEDGTDRLSRNVSPTTDQCCVTFQKSKGLICTVVEAMAYIATTR